MNSFRHFFNCCFTIFTSLPKKRFLFHFFREFLSVFLISFFVPIGFFWCGVIIFEFLKECEFGNSHSVDIYLFPLLVLG